VFGCFLWTAAIGSKQRAKGNDKSVVHYWLNKTAQRIFPAFSHVATNLKP
jgi:hypothetical protein